MSFRDAWQDCTLFSGPNIRIEEPAECKDCGAWFEARNVVRYSLDAYDEDPDSFCPGCGSDHLKFHKPREDRERERWEDR